MTEGGRGSKKPNFGWRHLWALPKANARKNFSALSARTNYAFSRGRDIVEQYFHIFHRHSRLLNSDIVWLMAIWTCGFNSMLSCCSHICFAEMLTRKYYITIIVDNIESEMTFNIEYERFWCSLFGDFFIHNPLSASWSNKYRNLNHFEIFLLGPPVCSWIQNWIRNCRIEN